MTRLVLYSHLYTQNNDREGVILTPAERKLTGPVPLTAVHSNRTMTGQCYTDTCRKKTYRTGVTRSCTLPHTKKGKKDRTSVVLTPADRHKTVTRQVFDSHLQKKERRKTHTQVKQAKRHSLNLIKYEHDIFRTAGNITKVTKSSSRLITGKGQ